MRVIMSKSAMAMLVSMRRHSCSGCLMLVQMMLVVNVIVFMLKGFV